MTAAYALIAAALFGAALVSTQFALRHMDALAGAKISIPAGATLFWLMFPVRSLYSWNSEGAAVFLAVGLFFPVAVTLLAYEANRRMGPTIAGAIGSTSPLFAVLGAMLFLGETLGMSQIVATVAIVAGSTVLVFGVHGRDSHMRRDGVQVLQGAAWLSWCAAALRALAQVIAKAGLLLWPNPYVAGALCYSVSVIAIWIIAAFSRRPESRVYTRRGIMWFVLTGLLNASAVLALYTALDGGEVKIVSPIAATYPMFTLVLNAVILREERLSARLIGGVALMVSGVAMLLALT
jgi:drug/metabolite transporter (DMT)-like permease